MNILALDTSSNGISLALSFKGKVFTAVCEKQKQASQVIIQEVEALLAKAQCHLDSLNALAIGQGPGALTGVRVGFSFVQALAFAKGLPLIGLSSLQIMAQTAFRLSGHKLIVPAIDARLQEIYWGIYQVGQEGLVEALQPDSLGLPKDLILNAQQEYFGVGNAWSVYEQELPKIANDANFSLAAEDMLKLAQKRLSEGGDFAAELCEPLYLRAAVTSQS